jgi:hypothetical protein
VTSIGRKQTLDMLQPAKMDPYGRAECLPGTRTEVLKLITEWATSPSEHSTNIFWLYGVAGSGKSALSTTIANLFQEMRRLGAYIYFNRHIAERSDPSSVISTLAYQLGSFDHRIGHAIASAIDATPDIVQSPGPFQFLKLLVEPLKALDELAFEGPIVVVLDALDECGSADDREELLQVLAQHSGELSSVFRFIVTSRPEYDIRYHFESQSNILSHKLNINSKDSRKDIEVFFRCRLAEIHMQNKPRLLPKDWPGDSQIRALVERASGLFIWASTACKFIKGYDPEARLRMLLQSAVSSDAESALDHLYVTALQSAGEWEDARFGADFRTVVGTILVARDLLSAAAIDKLLVLDGHRPSAHAISRLGCILYMNALIRLLHPSFADFLSNKLRCKHDDWFIDLNAHNLRIATNCLDRLDASLAYNVCGLQVASTPVDINVPEDVTYACTFWIDHVCKVTDVSLIVDKLEGFIFKHLLHWFEAMSILKRSREMIGLIRRLLHWMDVSYDHF